MGRLQELNSDAICSVVGGKSQFVSIGGTLGGLVGCFCAASLFKTAVDVPRNIYTKNSDTAAKSITLAGILFESATLYTAVNIGRYFGKIMGFLYESATPNE